MRHGPANWVLRKYRNFVLEFVSLVFSLTYFEDFTDYTINAGTSTQVFSAISVSSQTGSWCLLMSEYSFFLFGYSTLFVYILLWQYTLNSSLRNNFRRFAAEDIYKGRI